MGSVVLVSEGREQIHTRIRLAEHQGLDVIAGDFEANGFFESNGIGLMRSLLKHGGESKEFAGPGLIDYDFLMIFIDGGDAHLARDGDIRQTNISGFVYPLTRRIGLDVDLSGKDGNFLVVEEGEEGNGLEEFGFAAHGVLRWIGVFESVNADFMGAGWRRGKSISYPNWQPILGLAT